MTDQPVSKKRQRRPAARPEEILAAALDLFSERGFSATRLEDVASRAGLSKGAIYLYFKDKTALLEALVMSMAVTNLGIVSGLIELHRGPVAPLLREALGFMAGQIADSRLPFLIKLILSESRAHPEIGKLYLDNVIAKGLPMFQMLIERGIAQGEFRTVDAAMTVKSIIAPMLLAAFWKSVFEPLGAPSLDARAFADHHLDLLLEGLRP